MEHSGALSALKIFFLFSITVVQQNKKCVVVVILGLSKAEVVKWCLDNSFELIEMMSEEEEEEDDEEGILIIQYFLIKYNYTIFLY